MSEMKNSKDSRDLEPESRKINKIFLPQFCVADENFLRRKALKRRMEFFVGDFKDGLITLINRIYSAPAARHV
jgi:hypothetical protein